MEAIDKLRPRYNDKVMVVVCPRSVSLLQTLTASQPPTLLVNLWMISSVAETVMHNSHSLMLSHVLVHRPSVMKDPKVSLASFNYTVSYPLSPCSTTLELLTHPLPTRLPPLHPPPLPPAGGLGHALARP